MNATTTTTRADTADSPAAWFAVLEAARRKGDSRLEERARRQLERLGVRVTFDAAAEGSDGDA